MPHPHPSPSRQVTHQPLLQDTFFSYLVRYVNNVATPPRSLPTLSRCTPRLFYINIFQVDHRTFLSYTLSSLPRLNGQPAWLPTSSAAASSLMASTNRIKPAKPCLPKLRRATPLPVEKCSCQKNGTDGKHKQRVERTGYR